MSKKEIEMWDVEIKFKVRKGSHEVDNIRQLKENIINGIGGNEMNCIDVEDVEVKLK